MFMRVDRLQAGLPAPERADPDAAVQELFGGKYAEMSTLGDTMVQSFDFRSTDKLEPFDSLVAAIAAEELEVVDGMPEGGENHPLTGVPSAVTPDAAPEAMFEIAGKLYKASR